MTLAKYVLSESLPPSPTPSMKLTVCVSGSITSTVEALLGAQYSRPSGPELIPSYFWPNAPAPSMNIKASFAGSNNNTVDALTGAQYKPVGR